MLLHLISPQGLCRGTDRKMLKQCRLPILDLSTVLTVTDVEPLDFMYFFHALFLIFLLLSNKSIKKTSVLICVPVKID